MSKPEPSPSMKAFKAVQPFLFGGLSGMTATAIIQPIDMVKVRIQLLGAAGSSNPLTILTGVIKNEGFFALYKGLSAGLLRQATYTTARMGLFNQFIEAFKKQNDGGPVTYSQRAGASLAAGGLGALVGNPADLSLIRMQADGTMPAAQRRNYKNVGDALLRITREEGVLALWSGAGPTVVRAMALNLGMLATYSQAQAEIDKVWTPGTRNNLAASAVAGFFASAFSLPFDFVKTRLQKQKPDPVTGVLPYKSSLDCVVKVAKAEGLLAFYKGFPTYYIRIAPHVMLTLVIMDALKAAAKKYT